MSAGETTLVTAGNLPEHRTRRAPSDDVELFYRLFGEPGRTPILILHGANYYDSYDWIHVAAALAGDREVVTYDARGFGESGWSPSENYSLDAQLDDIEALLNHLGFERVILVAHSRGGAIGLRFAYEHPERLDRFAVVDFGPGRAAGAPNRAPIATGPRGAIFESLEAALVATSRDQSSLADPAKRSRIEMIFERDGDGWVNVQRDPAALSSRGPKDQPNWTPRYGEPFDLWEAVSSLQRPPLLVWATDSPHYNEERLAEFRRRQPKATIVAIESGHDIPTEAPAELIAAVKAWL